MSVHRNLGRDRRGGNCDQPKNADQAEKRRRDFAAQYGSEYATSGMGLTLDVVPTRADQAKHREILKKQRERAASAYLEDGLW